MFFPIPENTDKKTKTKFEEAWFRMFTVVINAVKIVLAAASVMLIYLLFGHSISGWFQGPDVLSPEEQKELFAMRGDNEQEEDLEKIENGIHLSTGLKVAEGWEVVRSTCTACHSAALVTQNRATYDGWKDMIRWMQETQGLWDLGDTEKDILAYLAENYAPEESGRRPNLPIADIEWYILELD